MRVYVIILDVVNQLQSITIKNKVPILVPFVVGVVAFIPQEKYHNSARQKIFKSFVMAFSSFLYILRQDNHGITFIKKNKYIKI
jgi:hypothetical protein